MQAPTGDLPEAAQRCFNPLNRLRGKYRRRRECDFCIPVCSYGACSPATTGSKALSLSRAFNRTIRHS